MHEETPDFIGNNASLTRRFGYWPSFHDAEVRRFDIVRGPRIEAEGEWGDVSIRADLFLFEYPEPDEANRLHPRKLTLATFLFEGVEALSLEYQHTNSYRDINGLWISKQERDDGPSPFFAVEFEKFPGGFGALFRCCRVSVVSVAEADAHGRLTHS